VSETGVFGSWLVIGSIAAAHGAEVSFALDEVPLREDADHGPSRKTLEPVYT
jgi:hypothetical protein